MKFSQSWIVGFLCVACFPAGAQTTATIDIDTTSTTPITPGFSGVSDDLGFPVEYWDYRFNALAAQVGYGWVRFPGGASSDIYNWQTGEDVAAWFAEFAGNTAGPQETVIALVAGRGGARLIDAANRANFLGASLIVCANGFTDTVQSIGQLGFTDTVQSIGQLAAYVKANQIPVAAWELSNEPYLFPDFFADATTYLDKMKPYRDAIKAVDPNATVAIFIRDPGGATAVQNSWDAAVAAYPNKYWDAITFHHYPPQSTGSFAQWMADESAVLATKTNTLVTGQLTPIGPPGVKFLNTEFDPSIPNDSNTGAVSITDGTLWGGIYAAEFTMRMSTVPSVLHVGPNEITNFAGVFANNGHQAEVTDAANAGNTIDTLSLNFGFYIGAQAMGQGVLNGVINRAMQANKTTVTGGAAVPATGITAGIPALYGVSYTNAAGGISVVITNKSAAAQQATIRVNGAAATGTFPLQFVTGSDPSAANSAANPNAVTIHTGSSSNPVMVPPYSVLRADVTTPPVATFVNSASFQPGAMAPQQLITAFGSGFASQVITAATQPLPTTLGDTSITITDSAGVARAAALNYVSPGQASFLIPAGVASGAASVKVARSGTTVLTGQLTVTSVSPGLYSANGNGAGTAAAAYVRASAPAAGAFVFNCQPRNALSCLSTPISLGAATDTIYVTLYGTGVRGAQKVQAFVAGQSVPVLYSGAQGQYQGLDQINITLPASLAGTGEASVYIVADGKTSNMTTINIQ
ncbi:exported hypothetical protein [Candidatus Sulfopaludibacter sp. SbA3]|nr:exported hypothetical protein [Candidatus Sulfopaludibacter sp. SbA3]